MPSAAGATEDVIRPRWAAFHSGERWSATSSIVVLHVGKDHAQKTGEQLPSFLVVFGRLLAVGEDSQGTLNELVGQELRLVAILGILHSQRRGHKSDASKQVAQLLLLVRLQSHAAPPASALRRPLPFLAASAAMAFALAGSVLPSTARLASWDSVSHVRSRASHPCSAILSRMASVWSRKRAWAWP